MATGNVQKMVKIGRVVSELCERTNTLRETDRQTDMLITILRTPPGGKVKTQSVIARSCNLSVLPHYNRWRCTSNARKSPE